MILFYLSFFNCFLITSPCAKTNFNSSSVLEGCFSLCRAWSRLGCIVFQAVLSDHVLESDRYFVLLLEGLSFRILLSDIFTLKNIHCLNLYISHTLITVFIYTQRCWLTISYCKLTSGCAVPHAFHMSKIAECKSKGCSTPLHLSVMWYCSGSPTCRPCNLQQYK